MYTQCPECSVAFRVTADVLKMAAGKVRCGGCGVAFNALEHLSETKPAAPPPKEELPDPDLLIRTGGEQRLSNFLLWQAAYAELYFTDCLWPDFDADALDQALTDFAGRQRRFGRTGAQLEAAD